MKAFLKYILSLIIFLSIGNSILQVHSMPLGLLTNAIHLPALNSQITSDFLMQVSDGEISSAASNPEKYLIKLKNLVFEFGEEDDDSIFARKHFISDDDMAALIASSLKVFIQLTEKPIPSSRLSDIVISKKWYILFQVFRI